MNDASISNPLQAIKRQTTENVSPNTLRQFLIDIWEIIEEAVDVLQTIDVTKFVSSLDIETLRNAIDFDRLPGSIRDGSISDAVDLSRIFDSTNKRELLDAINVLDFIRESDELRDEVDDVTQSDLADESTSKSVMDIDPDSIETTLQDTILEAIQRFRSALLSAHSVIRDLVEENQERFGSIADAEPHSMNPTAFSSIPKHNLGMVTTAHPSTIPRRVRHGSIINEPQIYGRRFEQEEES